MTQPTYSTDKLINELEAWDASLSQECFPNSQFCPFENSDAEITHMMCTQCPFSQGNRKQFLNTLKTIKLLELDHVAIPETPETDEGGE